MARSMAYLWFALCIVLIGCTSRDIIADARTCGEGPECKELWDKVRRKDDRDAKKEREAAPCPSGYVKYTTRHRSSCVSQDEIRRLMREMGHY